MGRSHRWSLIAVSSLSLRWFACGVLHVAVFEKDGSCKKYRRGYPSRVIQGTQQEISSCCNQSCTAGKFVVQWLQKWASDLLWQSDWDSHWRREQVECFCVNLFSADVSGEISSLSNSLELQFPSGRVSTTEPLSFPIPNMES